MSPDSVVVEVARLDLTDVPQDAVSELWRESDEQHVSSELRRKLAQHGFRSGILGSQLPSWITDRLADQNNLLQLDESERTAVVSDLLTTADPVPGQPATIGADRATVQGTARRRSRS